MSKPLHSTAPEPYRMDPPPRLSDVAYRFRGYCVACGTRAVTIEDARCVYCLAEPLRYCTGCGFDISPEIDREVVRRIRHASWDVNDAWISGGHFDAYRARERVMQARATSGGRK